MSEARSEGTAPRTVLVGVTGVGENAAALRYAADDAARRRWGIAVVHAVHQVMPPPPPAMLLTYESLEAVGEEIVTEVREHLSELAGSTLPIATHVIMGHPVNVLVDLSRGAGRVVVQRRALSPLRRLVTASTVIGCAAHAHCPVVAVPAEWTPSTTKPRVAVGVHEDGHPDQVLRVAFDEAHARGADLMVFHAWHLEPAYDGFVLDDRERSQWSQEAESAIAASVQPFRDAHPDVSVKVEVRRQPPADALADVSRGVDLLVLGRHGSFAPWMQRIGSLVRGAVGHAECPVMVVPVERHADAASDLPRADPRLTPRR